VHVLVFSLRIIQRLNHKTPSSCICGSIGANWTATKMLKRHWINRKYCACKFRVFTSERIPPKIIRRLGTRPQNYSPGLFEVEKVKKYRFELGTQLLDWPECRPARGAHTSRSVPGFIYVTVVREAGLQQRGLALFGGDITGCSFGPTGARIRQCFIETEANFGNNRLDNVSAGIRIGHLPNKSTVFTARTNFNRHKVM
jgi:hypothetical protein